MRGVYSVLLLVGLAACRSGGGAGTAQTLAQSEPAEVVAAGEPAESVGSFRVRVYVTPDYRDQNPGAEQQLERLMASASRILEQSMGARLELVEVTTWLRKGDGDAEAALAELEAFDPATDVDWVIGMLGALDHVASDMDKLGHARVLGRHLVVRGLNDAAEAALLDRVLTGASRSTRRDLYARRKRHKELVGLLHELAHTLGAMHVTDSSNIMHASYEPSQARFAQQNAVLMHVTARARKASTRPADEWAAVATHIREVAWSGWNQDEKAMLLAALDERVKNAGEAGTGMTLDRSVRSADRERFAAAQRLMEAGKPLDAWEDIEPLIELYPDQSPIQVVACEVAQAAGRDATFVSGQCQRAAGLAPGRAEPHLVMARAHLANGDKEQAFAAARLAQEQVEKTRDEADAKIWKELAGLYQKLGSVSLALSAAQVGSGPDEVITWAEQTRARFGLPAGAIDPDREAAYVDALQAMLGQVYRKNLKAAEKMADALDQSYGVVAGTLAARCDLELRRRDYRAARAQCDAAVAAYGDAAWAHYLLGLLDKRDKKLESALEHLERAIALYPDLKHAYQVAAQLAQSLGRKDDSERLRQSFRERFGSELPK